MRSQAYEAFFDGAFPAYVYASGRQAAPSQAPGLIWVGMLVLAASFLLGLLIGLVMPYTDLPMLSTPSSVLAAQEGARLEENLARKEAVLGRQPEAAVAPAQP